MPSPAGLTERLLRLGGSRPKPTGAIEPLTIVKKLGRLPAQKPVKVGTTIRTTSIVTDKYEKRGKYYDVWVVTVRDESGDEVMVAKYSEAALPEGQKVRHS